MARELYGIADPPPLPSSPEAERAILGAILLDNSAFYQTDRLTVEDFSLASHRLIFGAMNELMEDGKPIDFVTLVELLEHSAQAEDKSLQNYVGGVAYVTSLTDGLPRVKNIEQYVNIVIDLSQRRRLILNLQASLAEAYDLSQKTDDLVTKTDNKLLDIQQRKKSGPVKFKDILPLVNQRAEENRKLEAHKLIGFRSGIRELDEFTGGFVKREVSIISGWTSDGKTGLARQIALANLADGVKTLFVSREISKEQLADDFKAYVAEVSASHRRDKRKMDMFEIDNWDNKVDQYIRDWPLWIDDDRNLHIQDFKHRARKLIRTEGIELIVLDYLQLILGDGQNATAQMENVCKGFWDVVDQERVAGIALSQLTRDEKKQKRRPRLQDLKQASRIEQDAHKVIFVFRPEDEHGKLTYNDELIIAKDRHGATGTIWAEFDNERLIWKYRTGKYV